jgi:hypothetical protein
MKTSDVPFAAIRKVLLDLGFVETVIPGSHILFRHEPSGMVFMYRLYRRNERATLVDVRSTRKHLDEGGLLAAEGYDARLRKASA